MGTTKSGEALSDDLAEASRTPPQELDLDALYSASVVAKIWKIASKALQTDEPPAEFPEYTEPGGTKYVYSSVDFWTSGFFPGCLYLLRERQIKYPSRFPAQAAGGPLPHPGALESACKRWTVLPKLQASRTDTHDLGFMVQPWAQPGWTLDGDGSCREALVTAARSLATRFDARVGAIRSWDRCETKVYAFADPAQDFLVVIDNLMNLDLLYCASSLTGDPALAHIATTHALTTLRAHVRPDGSTAHLVVFDPRSGAVKATLTHQGYANASCWARGQAWAMAGFIQCYRWWRRRRRGCGGAAKEPPPLLLDAAVRTARYWVAHLPASGVAPWDFDAERERERGAGGAVEVVGEVPRDASATLVAAYALLLLCETLREGGGSGGVGEAEEFLQAALRSVRGVVDGCLASGLDGSGDAEDFSGQPESVVVHATINNFEHALRRWTDTGLVYADYYFLLVGNKLLQMGIV